jgi:GNAT superfamily N-acetyltransferase
MSTRVRPARRRDALSLAALRLQQEREAGCAARAGFLDGFADALLAGWDRHVAWVAADDAGRPVGYVLALRCPELPTLESAMPGETWLVRGEFVTADRRADGWADRLVEAMEEAARSDGIRRVVRELPR